MSILDKIFRREKAQMVNRQGSFYAGGSIPPDNRDFLQNYTSVGWWHAVGFRIALGLSEVKWTLFDISNKDKPQQIYEHRILDLLHLMNPFQTSEEVIALDSIYMENLGESFWALNFNKSGEPQEIILPYPQNMSVVPDKAFPFVKGYVYGTGENAIPFALDEIIHFKFPNPLNQYRGLGQAQAIGVNLSAQSNADKWVNQFFYNSARPDGVIQFDYNLSDEQFEKLKKQWNEKYQGVNKAHQVALLEGGGKYVQVQNTVKDMDFPNLQLKNRDIILGVEGMPQSVMGISENVNKANAEAGDYTFARWIVKPRLDWKRAKLQEQLIPKFKNSKNLLLGYEEVVPETIDQKKELAESGMRAGYLTINEARKLRGLDTDPNGDVYLIPLNLVPTPSDKLSQQIESIALNPPRMGRPGQVGGSSPASDNEPQEEISEEVPEEEVIDIPEIPPKSFKGGGGSGNYGHEGRPGEVGGSGPSSGGSEGDGKPSGNKPKPSGGKPTGNEPSEGHSSGISGEEWANSLSDDERKAVESWQIGDWESIREYQKTGKGEGKELNDKWQSALGKDGSYEGTVYRGIGNLDEESLGKLTSAKTLTLKADSSSSMDAQQAASFALSGGLSKSSSGVMYKINAKTGVNITPASSKPYTSQMEVILKQGTTYNITKRTKEKYSLWGKTYNITTLHLEEQ